MAFQFLKSKANLLRKVFSAKCLLGCALFQTTSQGWRSSVAQLVRHSLRERRVRGSNPGLDSDFFRRVSRAFWSLANVESMSYSQTEV